MNSWGFPEISVSLLLLVALGKSSCLNPGNNYSLGSTMDMKLMVLGRVVLGFNGGTFVTSTT